MRRTRAHELLPPPLRLGLEAFAIGSAALLLVLSLREDSSRYLAAAGWMVVIGLLGVRAGQREQRLEQLSSTDPLTGLYNRRTFEESLRRELARTARHHDPVALLMFDLDGLKGINDHQGHYAGDAAIIAVADALRETCRASDVCARWGGDEFVVLAPHTDSALAEALSQRICAAVRTQSAHSSAQARLRGQPAAPWVTVSVGVAVARDEEPRSLSPATLFATADRAMYRQKGCRSGPDRAAPERSGPDRKCPVLETAAPLEHPSRS